MAVVAEPVAIPQVRPVGLTPPRLMVQPQATPPLTPRPFPAAASMMPAAPTGYTTTVAMTTMSPSLSGPSASPRPLPPVPAYPQPAAVTALPPQATTTVVLPGAASNRPPVPMMPPVPVGGLPTAGGMAPPPGAPPALTVGIPNPQDIDSQRSAYARSLDAQLEHGTSVLDSQFQQQRHMLQQLGQQQKQEYGIEVDRKIMAQDMILAKQRDEQMLLLKQSTQQQRAALDQQANALLMEYNQKKSQEDMMAQQYQFQLERYQAHLRHTAELQAMQQAQLQNRTQAFENSRRLQLSRGEIAGQQAALRQQSVTASQQAALAAQIVAGSSAQIAGEASRRPSYVPPVATTYIPPRTPHPTVMTTSMSYAPPPVVTMSPSYAPPAVATSFSYSPPPLGASVPHSLASSYAPPPLASVVVPLPATMSPYVTTTFAPQMTSSPRSGGWY
mmetsp:Transcript_56593/g.104752  ORF Transcript_56593/g.104752 Transcript_56593/m.104752 type:complete len:444 (-) Transcript_56593:161-1492(-)